jgi:uncharacterized protein YndB with AHSA1/START domain
VNERLGSHAYALYSDACIQAMGIDPLAQRIADINESIDIIGDVKCWVRDLQEAWEQEGDRQRNEVTSDKAAGVFEFEIAAPRAKVWEYFTLPGLRPKWRAADEVRESVDGGRRGVGTTNHCMHGPHAIIEELLDWRPVDYFTISTLLPVPDAPKILLTFAFSESAAGSTHVEIRVGKPKPKDKASRSRKTRRSSRG